MQWQSRGPGPNTVGQVENITDREVVGAVNTVAVHPTNPNVIFVGAVNGGIWRSNNALAASPTWVPQTDDQGSLSIGAIEFDPTDPSSQTLLAGIGRFSSFSGFGGDRLGVLRTTNGGTDWTLLDGGGTLTGLNVSGVAPRGNTLVISTNAGGLTGIWRSIDAGATWTRVSGFAGSGLPTGRAFDLASDPNNNARLYTHASTNGIFRSDNTGLTWTKVSDAAVDAALAGSSRVEISVGTSNNVYVAIVTGGTLGSVFRSGNAGGAWTAMDLPTTAEGGIHLGGQGGTHLSLVADPSNANVVYIGGDRQGGGFPNSIGANDFSGRLFRGDASQPSGSQWVHLTHSRFLGPPGGGTFSSSSPHADSRDMAFTSSNQLIEVNDGGIYRRTVPQSNLGNWFSINGSAATTEFHNLSWDPVSNILVGGAQDTGSPEQILTSNTRWRSISTADGGDVAVSSLGIFSVRYSSIQGLGGFRRRVLTAANNVLISANPALFVLGGGNPIIASFVNPIETNPFDPARLIIGAANSTYESTDFGNTVREVGPGIGVNGFGRDPIGYGAGGNPDALYVGSGSNVFIRTAPFPAPLVNSAAYPGTGTVADIVLDPDDAQTAFVIDAGAVFQTTTAGAAWNVITGNLQTIGAGTLRSVTYGTATGDGTVIVGAQRGVFAARGCTGFSVWNRLGTGLPAVNVFDLDYDESDEILAAGTLGRGAWTLSFAAPAGVARIQIPGTTDLGAVCVGETARGTVEVCNTGSANLNVDPITSSDPQFSVTTPSGGFPVVISPDFCFPFEVVFTPAGPGPQSTTLTIPSNDPSSTCTTAQVVASGGIPDIRVTGSTDFGTGSERRPTEKTVAVCNTGGCNLSVAAAAIGCPDFTAIADPFPATVSPDSCLDLTVRFTPVLPGKKSCSLDIFSDDPDTPVVNRTLTARTPPALSFHAGIVDPHGALGNTTKEGSIVQLDYVQPVSPQVAWDLRAGLASFDGQAGFDDVDLLTLLADARFTFNPAAAVRFTLHGGGGLYHFDPGDLEGGLNIGLGLSLDAALGIDFEAAVTYHSALTANPNLEYLQVLFGLLFSF